MINYANKIKTGEKTFSMLFNSVEFLFIFLPIVLIMFYSIGSLGHHKVAISWLVLASLFFYGWWNPAYLILILASMLFNYGIGIAIKSQNNQNISKLILIFGVFINLIALGYFKYANFFVDNINLLLQTNYNINNIILPLAISFFTFQQITYLVDTYKGKTHEYRFLHYALFVTFFPQLIAGPIVHHKEMLPQFSKDSIYKFIQNNFALGISIFLLGLFKKIVLADNLALYATPVFNLADTGSVITFFAAWIGALSYTFQLYFDFSGYSDMAIGLALMFNIKLPINFNSPYKAVNIIEFWKRWHITLSKFLKEYVYIPLGGNRNGVMRRYLNIMITMFLGGIWHGAGWTYIIWGILHGLYLIINHIWHKIRQLLKHDLNGHNLIMIYFSTILTFISVVIAWVIFRAENISSAINIIKGMFGINGFVLSSKIIDMFPFLHKFIHATEATPLLAGGQINVIIGLLFISFIIIFLPPIHKMSNKTRLFALLVSIYFTITALFFKYTPSEFLYFQF